MTAVPSMDVGSGNVSPPSVAQLGGQRTLGLPLPRLQEDVGWCCPWPGSRHAVEGVQVQDIPSAAFVLQVQVCLRGATLLLRGSQQAQLQLPVLPAQLAQSATSDDAERHHKATARPPGVTVPWQPPTEV